MTGRNVTDPFSPKSLMSFKLDWCTPGIMSQHLELSSRTLTTDKYVMVTFRSLVNILPSSWRWLQFLRNPRCRRCWCCLLSKLAAYSFPRGGHRCRNPLFCLLSSPQSVLGVETWSFPSVFASFEIKRKPSQSWHELATESQSAESDHRLLLYFFCWLISLTFCFFVVWGCFFWYVVFITFTLRPPRIWMPLRSAFKGFKGAKWVNSISWWDFDRSWRVSWNNVLD